MPTPPPAATRDDRRLWVVALGLSLALNALLLLLAGFSIANLEKHRPKIPTAKAPEEEIEVLRIEPAAENQADAENAAAAPEPEPESGEAAATPPPRQPPPADSNFARTSDDQIADRPDKPTHIGERNTRATSDAAPDPNAPLRPAQAGVAPLAPGHVETTESKYQDGELASDGSPLPDSPPTAQPPAPPDPATAANPGPAAPAAAPSTQDPPAQQAAATPETRHQTIPGGKPVDIPVPKPAETAKRDVPPAPPKPAAPENSKTATARDQIKETERPAPPAFRGNQRKTILRGSLDRTGRSALDVEDTPLGRYQAVIGRAVELEWQRNCARYRDYITPGFFSVRFFVNSKGKVQSVEFMGTMQTGEHQKGFTLDSIRKATIPPMPAALARELGGENLEMIFNFYF